MSLKYHLLFNYYDNINIISLNSIEMLLSIDNIITPETIDKLSTSNMNNNNLMNPLACWLFWTSLNLSRTIIINRRIILNYNSKKNYYGNNVNRNKLLLNQYLHKQRRIIYVFDLHDRCKEFEYDENATTISMIGSDIAPNITLGLYEFYVNNEDNNTDYSKYDGNTHSAMRDLSLSHAFIQTNNIMSFSPSYIHNNNNNTGTKNINNNHDIHNETYSIRNNSNSNHGLKYCYNLIDRETLIIDLVRKWITMRLTTVKIIAPIFCDHWTLSSPQQSSIPSRLSSFVPFPKKLSKQIKTLSYISMTNHCIHTSTSSSHAVIKDDINTTCNILTSSSSAAANLHQSFDSLDNNCSLLSTSSYDHKSPKRCEVSNYGDMISNRDDDKNYHSSVHHDGSSRGRGREEDNDCDNNTNNYTFNEYFTPTEQSKVIPLNSIGDDDLFTRTSFNIVKYNDDDGGGMLDKYDNYNNNDDSHSKTYTSGSSNSHSTTFYDVINTSSSYSSNNVIKGNSDHNYLENSGVSSDSSKYNYSKLYPSNFIIKNIENIARISKNKKINLHHVSHQELHSINNLHSKVHKPASTKNDKNARKRRTSDNRDNKQDHDSTHHHPRGISSDGDGDSYNIHQHHYHHLPQQCRRSDDDMNVSIIGNSSSDCNEVFKAINHISPILPTTELKKVPMMMMMQRGKSSSSRYDDDNNNSYEYSYYTRNDKNEDENYSRNDKNKRYHYEHRKDTKNKYHYPIHHHLNHNDHSYGSSRNNRSPLNLRKKDIIINPLKMSSLNRSTSKSSLDLRQLHEISSQRSQSSERTSEKKEQQQLVVQHHQQQQQQKLDRNRIDNRCYFDNCCQDEEDDGDNDDHVDNDDHDSDNNQLSCASRDRSMCQSVSTTSLDSNKSRLFSNHHHDHHRENDHDGYNDHHAHHNDDIVLSNSYDDVNSHQLYSSILSQGSIDNITVCDSYIESPNHHHHDNIRKGDVNDYLNNSDDNNDHINSNDNLMMSSCTSYSISPATTVDVTSNNNNNNNRSNSINDYSIASAVIQSNHHHQTHTLNSSGREGKENLNINDFIYMNHTVGSLADNNHHMTYHNHVQLVSSLSSPPQAKTTTTTSIFKQVTAQSTTTATASPEETTTTAAVGCTISGCYDNGDRNDDYQREGLTSSSNSSGGGGDRALSKGKGPTTVIKRKYLKAPSSSSNNILQSKAQHVVIKVKPSATTIRTAAPSSSRLPFSSLVATSSSTTTISSSATSSIGGGMKGNSKGSRRKSYQDDVYDFNMKYIKNYINKAK